MLDLIEFKSNCTSSSLPLFQQPSTDSRSYWNVSGHQALSHSQDAPKNLKTRKEGVGWSRQITMNGAFKTLASENRCPMVRAQIFQEFDGQELLDIRPQNLWLFDAVYDWRTAWWLKTFQNNLHSSLAVCWRWPHIVCATKSCTF